MSLISFALKICQETCSHLSLLASVIADTAPYDGCHVFTIGLGFKAFRGVQAVDLSMRNDSRSARKRFLCEASVDFYTELMLSMTDHAFAFDVMLLLK